MTQQTAEEQEIKGAPEHEGARGGSKGNYYKKKFNKGKSRPDSKTGKPTNDPAYYSKYPELLESSSHLNYSEPFGRLINFKTKYDGLVSVIPGSNCRRGSIPGVLGIRTKPSYGFNDKATSPLNVAANAFYVDVRTHVSGRKNYDPVDLVMYLGAIAELYSAVNWAARIYYLAFEQSQVNKYVNRGIAKAMYVDLDDVIANLANYRYRLNAFIKKINAYAIPNSMAYYLKKVDQYTYIYIENNDQNIKDQMYLFYPDGFHRFGLDDSGAGMLEYRRIGYDVQLKVTDIFNILEDLIQPIWGDEDFALMSGDIIKAYEGKIIGLTEIPETGTLELRYDELTLLQIKNSNPVEYLDGQGAWTSTPTYSYIGADGSTRSAKPGNVYQDKNGMVISRNIVPVTKDYNLFMSQANWISQISPNPGVDDNMESTRLKITPIKLAISTTTSGIKADWYHIDSGVYIISDVSAVIFTGYNNDVNGHPDLFNMKTGVVNSSELTYAWHVSGFAFKFFPNTIVWDITVDAAEAVNVNRISFGTNMDNCTIVSDEQIQRMHECAWLSLFAVEGPASVKNTLV